MDKFKIDQMVRYFVDINKDGKSYKDLSKEDMVSLAVFSLFDKSGKVVKTSQNSYNIADGVVDESEFNVTKAEYEKAAKQIEKAIKKEVGKEYSLKVPSYDDIQQMMKDDKKVTMDEIKFFAKTGNIKPETKEPLKLFELPQKTEPNMTKAEIAAEYEAMVKDPYMQALIDKFDKMTDEEYKAFVDNAMKALPKSMRDEIANFEPDKNVASNKQQGKVGLQYNENGQVIMKVNEPISRYQYLKYSSDDSKRFSEMMSYNEKGYKSEYWKQAVTTDPTTGEQVPFYFIYCFDEKEEVREITTFPSDIVLPQEVEQFNELMLYRQFDRYYMAVHPEAEVE